MLQGRAPRSGDRPGLEQETWPLLHLYKPPRMAMVDAVETRPGIYPDRARVTTAMDSREGPVHRRPGIRPDGPAT